MSVREEREELRRTLGRVGVWSFALQAHPAATEREAAREVEALGFPALWFPESVGSKEVFAHASILLGATGGLAVCSGIANIWARDPVAMANGAKALAEAHPGRFVLGLGVSHEPSVARRGGRYERPYRRMRAYLEAMDAARYDGPEPPRPVPRLLAALGPRMLELAAERALGAHPYFAPPEHTAFARGVLGPDPVLAVELTAILETDPAEARRVARGFAAGYLELPNYYRNLRRMGFSEEDLSGGGADRMVDAVFAWGDVEAIRDRVALHLEEGADHVCVQVISGDPADPCLPQLRELAPALLGLSRPGRPPAPGVG